MPARPRPTLSDDIELEDSVSRSWFHGPHGTLCHRESGLRVSPVSGIEYEGQEFRLAAEDIELETDTVLGSGASSTVRRGWIKTTGDTVAVKTLRVDHKEQRSLLLNEVKGLIESRGCKNLVQWHAGFVARNGLVHLVLELMDKGSLADVLRRLGGKGLPPNVLGGIMLQMLTGLHHLHSRRLQHNDIKPGNVLLNHLGEVKVTDFGITKSVDATLGSLFVGTIIYSAPEKSNHDSPVEEGMNLLSDIWSLGILVYECASGVHPFAECTKPIEVFFKLLHAPEPRLSETDYPGELCDFVSKCLARSPASRASVEELLEHPFLALAASQEEISDWLAKLP